MDILGGSAMPELLFAEPTDVVNLELFGDSPPEDATSSVGAGDAGEDGGGTEDLSPELAAAANYCYESIVEDVLFGFCLEMHQAAKTGKLSALEVDERCAQDPEIVNQPGLDIFGQRTNTKKPLECVCPHCSRNMAASRFAPHLEKCMGKGRNSSRLASKRIASSKVERHESDGDSVVEDVNDVEWSAHGERKGKRPRREKHTQPAVSVSGASFSQPSLSSNQPPTGQTQRKFLNQNSSNSSTSQSQPLASTTSASSTKALPATGSGAGGSGTGGSGAGGRGTARRGSSGSGVGGGGSTGGGKSKSGKKAGGSRSRSETSGGITLSSLFSNMSFDGRQTILQTICAAETDEKQLCTRSVRCSLHSEKQRLEVRNILLNPKFRQPTVEPPVDDVQVDIDTYDDADGRLMRDSLWDSTPKGSPADSTSTVASGSSKKRGRGKKNKKE